MTGHVTGGILRVASRIANTVATEAYGFLLVTLVVAAFASKVTCAQDQQTLVDQVTRLETARWDFSRASDQNFDNWPDGWQRYRGTGYPAYVNVAITARDPDQERQFLALDTGVVRFWPRLRKSYPSLPVLPPSVTDAIVDRYLRVELDGGQVKLQSPGVPASRMYQYRFSCRMMTQGLRHDTAHAELVFVDEDGDEIAAHSTTPLRGTTRWDTVTMDLVRPPVGAAKMLVRLVVERSEDGLEDIHGTIGFDDIRIDRYPQLRVTTDEALGIYALGRPVVATATIMGLPAGASKVQFQLFDSSEQVIAETRLAVRHQASEASGAKTTTTRSPHSEVTWKLPRLEPGFYRVSASLVGEHASTLATETTLAVVEQLIGGSPHGAFGWTLPTGNEGIAAKVMAPWLADLGVAWVKYPCWLAPEDTAGAEEIAAIFSKLQDAGIQTVGMLDVPPEEQVSMFALRGRRDVVAAQLFRDIETWQPLLEPVMTRLTLKVRTWQLGADRDHSFMGRPRLRETISTISDGLQGFGQPIDVAICWPWLEGELPPGESSWQAVCRSSDPPLAAQELDAFLTIGDKGARVDGPRTWLLLDPISADRYDRDSRIRDLVLRMAAVRSHRVQAAFVSNPRDPQHGLLRPNGRPDTLLLPWRTTSRLIGNLRHAGSLQLRSGARNAVFAGSDRAVLMLWSAEPTEELIYLGEHVQAVDVWGKVTNLETETGGNQPAQRIKIGPVPIFILGADPTLLAFRMSVEVEPNQLDSFLGQTQRLSVSFANPTRESILGEMHVRSPQTWAVETPSRSWEALAGRSATHDFNVVLSNTAKIGSYDVPIQFEIETVPPQLITVYRNVNVGPEGIKLNVTTRLLRNNELRVQIEMTNEGTRPQSYDCLLFPPPDRQYQRQFVTIKPGETIRREIYWPDGDRLIGQRMLLRAVEQDGRRVLNYAIDVTR